MLEKYSIWYNACMTFMSQYEIYSTKYSPHKWIERTKSTNDLDVITLREAFVDGH
jgi:hypothetical protein